jgi:hypothetical protein
MFAPQNFLEKNFMGLMKRLPILPNEIVRNSFGVLSFKWDAPCFEVDALWVSIKPKEIILSCKIAHSHFSYNRYLGKKMTKLKLKKKIVKDAIREIMSFLESRIAVTVSNDKKGNVYGYGWCNLNQVSAMMMSLQKASEQQLATRIWTWSGEEKLP